MKSRLGRILSCPLDEHVKIGPYSLQFRSKVFLYLHKLFNGRGDLSWRLGPVKINGPTVT
jgi:hypothetical protein